MSSSLRVRDYMTSPVITFDPDMDITRAVRRLIDDDISGAPIIDPAIGLVGIITERDCLEIALQAGYFGTPGGPLRDYMTTSVESVDPEMGIVDLAKRLVNTRHRRFPVVSRGELIGIITRRDVLSAMFPR